MRTIPPASSTDLYQLTMAAGHWTRGTRARATFELFTRRLPAHRGYLLADGIEAAVDYLVHFRFTDGEIAYLRSLPAFAGVAPGFFDALAELRFTGDVEAVRDGTPVFPGEPFLTVSASVIEAQLVETALIAIVNFPTSVATKASRLVEAARGRSIAEFGARRAHGTEAALIASRAAHIGGASGTSNVEAGLRFGLPVVGTVAHAWIMAFDDEVEAFRAYHNAFPHNTILLIDTYDTVRAAHRLTAAFRPGEIAGVRLDSGDLGQLAREVRAVLDAAGFTSTRIVASGDLNEWSIAKLVDDGAPIDAFGVGTDLVTVRDAPSLGVVYKLVEYEEDGVVDFKMKFSDGKATWPGRKQIWRTVDDGGRYAGDVVTLRDEPAPAPGARPLLAPVVRCGARFEPPRPLDELRADARSAVAMLPDRLRTLEGPEDPYPVRFSDPIREIAAGIRSRMASTD